METILEFAPRPEDNGKSGWWQMVTVEGNGLRHVLTVWKAATRVEAIKAAKREGIRLVEVAP